MRLPLAFALLTVLTLPAFAGYPPIKYKASRAEIAAKCDALGAQGQGKGLDARSGAYSCQNLATGNLVECTAEGLCTSYSGDPRVKRLKLPLA